MTIVSNGNVLVKAAGRNWTIKTMLLEGRPFTWNGMARGVTVVEHKYAQKDPGTGHYHVEIHEYEGKTWLVYEVDVPESVRKHAREVLKSFGIRWHRVMSVESMNNWIQGLYDRIGRLNSLQGHVDTTSMRAEIVTRMRVLRSASEYHAYKALIEPLACKQLEDYYETVTGNKL